MTQDKIAIVSFYSFTNIEEPEMLIPKILLVGKKKSVRGTVLLAKEGFNGSISGTRETTDILLQEIILITGATDVNVKTNYDDEHPFHKLKVKLKPEEQQAVRDVTRILGSEFLSNVKANKGLLGVNPTDNDARLLQAPMASAEDSSKAVQLWARQQVLLNKQREALYGAYQQHADTAGPAASPRTFFSPGSIYEKINKDYAQHRMQLFNQFHPQ